MPQSMGLQRSDMTEQLNNKQLLTVTEEDSFHIQVLVYLATLRNKNARNRRLP